MVPGNFGCGSVVFAAITMFAPDCAALFASAKPIPLEPPVTRIVFPANDSAIPYLLGLGVSVFRLRLDERH